MRTRHSTADFSHGRQQLRILKLIALLQCYVRQHALAFQEQIRHLAEQEPQDGC